MGGCGSSGLQWLWQSSASNPVASQCPLQEMRPQLQPADVLPKLQAMARADRAVFEKGMCAFVSFVQAYAKHECNLIFRLKGEQLAGPSRGVPGRRVFEGSTIGGRYSGLTPGFAQGSLVVGLRGPHWGARD